MGMQGRSFQSLSHNSLNIRPNRDLTPVGGMYQGPNQTVHDAVASAQFPGGQHTGGNDPLMQPSANNPVSKTLIISAENGPYDSHQGSLLFESRNSLKIKNYRSPIIRKSIGAMNWYLRFGEGHTIYGKHKTAEPFLRDWALTGTQWTQPRLPGDAMSSDYVQVAENTHVGGCTHTKQIWTARHNVVMLGKRPREVPGATIATEGDSLFLVFRRVLELDSMSGQVVTHSSRRYWVVEPLFSFSDEMPCAYAFTASDMRGIEDFVGHCWKVGRLMERDTHQGVNSRNANSYNAYKALFPTELQKGSYIDNWNKLGTIHIRRQY